LDHINVFPTYDNYVDIRIFVDSIVKGGSITYNEEDLEVDKVVKAPRMLFEKLPISYSFNMLVEKTGQTIFGDSKRAHAY